MQQHSATENLPILKQQQEQQIFLPFNSIMQQSPPTSAHCMPTPTPNWSIETMPWKITKSDHIGNVMEFTAQGPHKNSGMRALLHQKRKLHFNALAALPVKQFISEEKITAHLNGLHISNDYIVHNTNGDIEDINDDELPSTSGKYFSNLTYEDYQVTGKELEEKLRNANRITICEQLKKYNEDQKRVSYLPEALLHRIQSPCTALVLWQPSPITSMVSQKNMDVYRPSHNDVKKNETIEDYSISDVDLPAEQTEVIEDFIDNNNSCRLDFNTLKPDSMDEDL